MTIAGNIIKITVFISFIIPVTIYAQSGHKSSWTQDTSKIQSKISDHSLFAGTGYGSNMIYLGSTISHNQPFGYGSLSYGFKNEFYVTVSAVHLAKLNPYLAFYIGSVNYNHVFNKWLDISADICRYHVVPSLTDTLFNSFTYTGLTIGFDWKLIYTKVSAGGLFSVEDQAYFQIRNSRYFQTSELFHGKANISFDPYVNLLFGTYTKVKTTSETVYYYSVSSPFRKARKNGHNSGTGTTYTYSDRFGLLETDFGLPVALNTDRFTIEAEPSYILPVDNDAFSGETKGFIFQLTIFFRFF